MSSKVASSSTSKRNWSTYSFIHSVKHNKLLSKRAEDLVYMHSNLHLLSHKQHDYKEGEMELWDIPPEDTNLDASTSHHIAYKESDIQQEHGHNTSGSGSAIVTTCGSSSLPTSSNVNVNIDMDEYEYDD